MTQGEDEQLRHLLQRNAPPERDPLFRIKVLERRERQRFRRHVALLLSAILAIVAILALGASVGGRLNEVARVVVVLIAVTVYAPALMRLLRGYKS